VKKKKLITLLKGFKIYLFNLSFQIYNNKQIKTFQYNLNKRMDQSVTQYSSDPNERFLGIFINLDTLKGKVFLVFNVFLFLFYSITLILLWKYKSWYLIKQRNFALTFIGGCANFVSTYLNAITEIMEVPCAVSYYSATVFTFVSQICFVSRALRLILLYKLNIFKVTELSQKKFIQNSNKGTMVEPNIYYKSIYKMVDKTFVKVLVITCVAVLSIFSFCLHVLSGNGKICGFIPTNINNKILSSNANESRNHMGNPHNMYEKMKVMFTVPVVMGVAFIICNIIITIIFTITNIKDDQRLGIKFDCFSNSVMHIIAESLYFFIQSINIGNGEAGTVDSSSFKGRLKTWTKDGIYLFVFCGIYLHLTSVVIPIIKCIKAERLNKKYANEPTNTMQYFYKILNSPNLVEELKAIAIQDFVVENVLFWENYCILQKLVTRAKQKQELSNDGSGNSHHQKFTLQDIYSQNSGSNDDDSYDPNYPLLPQLVPYYNAFYHTFIDVDGPAAVNISGNTVRRIYHDFYTYPTVGIFDEAKDEVVESMFVTIFPALLQNNRKQLGELYSHYP